MARPKSTKCTEAVIKRMAIEHALLGMSFRDLGKKYDIPFQTVYDKLTKYAEELRRDPKTMGGAMAGYQHLIGALFERASAANFTPEEAWDRLVKALPNLDRFVDLPKTPPPPATVVVQAAPQDPEQALEALEHLSAVYRNLAGKKKTKGDPEE